MVPFVFQKNKNKKKGKDEKCGSEVTTPENSSSPGMMDMHGEWEKVSTNYPITLLWKYKLTVSNPPLLSLNQSENGIRYLLITLDFCSLDVPTVV